MMKRCKNIASVLAALLLAALLLSCTSSDDGGEWASSASAYDVLERMIASADEYAARDNVVYLGDGLLYRGDSEVEGEYLTDMQKSLYYGTIAGDPDFSGVTDYALWTTVEAASTEMGVFLTADKKAEETVTAFIGERIKVLRENAKGYKPEEQEKAEQALVVSKGRYVIYLVTGINGELEATAEAAITEKSTANE